MPFGAFSPNSPSRDAAEHGQPALRVRTSHSARVEPRPKGRPEGSPIEDYVVEDHADHPLAVFHTQEGAIDWAKQRGHAPLVARVRHLNDKMKPDHWREA